MSDRLVGRPLFEAPAAPPYQSHELHPQVFTRRQCERIVVLGSRLATEEATLEGLDGEELAQVLGISRSGADAALSRARKRLRKVWGERMSF